MKLTTDKNDPELIEGQKNETGQHKIYLVLSEEERDQGFVRPYRDTYVHVGKLNTYWKSIHRMLDDDDIEMKNKGYVAVMTQLVDEDGNFKGGAYVTQEELNAWVLSERVGGCNTETTMGKSISETYARNPNFYGSTFCVNCNKHLPVNEFIWKNTNEEVGS